MTKYIKTWITTFILLINIGIIIGILSYNKQSNQKRSTLMNLRLHESIDSVRLATIDSMQIIIREIVSKTPRESDKLKSSIELYKLIYLFTPDENIDYNLLDWKTGANNPAITWITHGIDMNDSVFFRSGEAVVSINNKKIECLDIHSSPCSWNIELSGPRGGYTSFEISSVHSQKLEPVSLEELFNYLRFDARIINEDDYQKTYFIKFPKKKPIKMLVQWTCGSGGCSLNLKCKTLD